MNSYWLFLIIPFSILLGFGICFWYILHTLKKVMGIKSWKEFIQQIKKQQEFQGRIKRGGIREIINDPELKKQMEEFKKRFKT